VYPALVVCPSRLRSTRRRPSPCWAMGRIARAARSVTELGGFLCGRCNLGRRWHPVFVEVGAFLQVDLRMACKGPFPSIVDVLPTLECTTTHRTELGIEHRLVADRTSFRSLFAHDAHSLLAARRATKSLRTASAGGRPKSATTRVGVSRRYSDPARRQPPLPTLHPKLLLYPSAAREPARDRRARPQRDASKRRRCRDHRRGVVTGRVGSARHELY
jgi:hypothetical protein